MPVDYTDRRQRAEHLAGPLPPLLVAADRVASTVAQGVHGRRRVGVGESFWQFRRYSPGDSLSRIDWRQTAKSQNVYIREHEWEASQTIWLWRSGHDSMDFASSRNLSTKQNRADLLILALCSLLNRAGERFGLLGGGVRAASGRTQMDRMTRALSEPPANGLPTPEAIPRHAGAVLIDDFLTDFEATERFLHGLASRDVSGHLLQVLDPAEATLPYNGRIRFRGVKDSLEEMLIPRVESVRQAYLRRLEERQERLRDFARRSGWTFAVHRTDQQAQSGLLYLYAALTGNPSAAGG